MDGRWRTLLTLGCLGMAQSLAFASPLPKPIVTNKTKFRIPFKVEPAALQKMNARELQLHVSTDRGLTWQLSQSLTPNEGKFEYEATTDGEFWFSVKTLDGRGLLHPPTGSYETGLIVVVDSSPPELELTLNEVSPGKLQLTWKATDSHLDPESLKLEYFQPGGQAWESVDVTPRANGQAAWTVAQTGQVTVRGTVSDTASNVGRNQSQIQIQMGNESAPIVPKSNRRVPVADANESLNQNQLLFGPETTQREISRTPSGGNDNSSDSNSRLELTESPIETGEYRGPIITPFGGSASFPVFQGTTAQSQSPICQLPTRSPIGSGISETESLTGLGTKSLDSSQSSISSNPSSSNAPRFAGRQRLVNSRRFQIGYRVDDIGPSGIGAVEVFITQDNGRKWWKYGEDTDHKSPFDVEVPSDGEYGFAIRVRSGVGLADEPPAPGEPPSIVVAVDQTAPRIEMLPVQQGQGPNVNRLMVRWRIDDEHPADKPVSLFYAGNRNGPWQPISGWNEDGGSYEWIVGPGVPSQLFLRVVARDSAGNTSKADSPTAVVVDLLRPTARIVDIESPSNIGPR